MRIAVVLAVLFAVAGGPFYATCSIFVVQPIGAVPEGRTVIITRLSSVNFIDSADAWCARNQDRVNILCRAAVLGRVAGQAEIIARLPYSETLYELSTGGVRYVQDSDSGQ
ncbi:hypothetical protein [Rhodovibrio sodomensis]|uniref:hypothetical protein n=1 Tax=Rhodovibrio sodomensis TaxID=1088 RepID=UPI0019058F6E